METQSSASKKDMRTTGSNNRNTERAPDQNQIKLQDNFNYVKKKKKHKKVNTYQGQHHSPFIKAEHRIKLGWTQRKKWL